jgi:hypothetical protein
MFSVVAEGIINFKLTPFTSGKCIRHHKNHINCFLSYFQQYYLQLISQLENLYNVCTTYVHVLPLGFVFYLLLYLTPFWLVPNIVAEYLQLCEFFFLCVMTMLNYYIYKKNNLIEIDGKIFQNWNNLGKIQNVQQYYCLFLYTYPVVVWWLIWLKCR